MPIRTTDGEIRQIIEADDNIALSLFIRPASSLVDRVKALDTAGLLSDDLLKDIETWLSAHFYAHRDQLLSSEATQQSSGAYQGQFGMGLSSTQYGQTAMILDFTGTLARLNEEAAQGAKRKVGILWAGKPESQQIRYLDRP